MVWHIMHTSMWLVVVDELLLLPPEGPGSLHLFQLDVVIRVPHLTVLNVRHNLFESWCGVHGVMN